MVYKLKECRPCSRGSKLVSRMQRRECSKQQSNRDNSGSQEHTAGQYSTEGTAQGTEKDQFDDGLLFCRASEKDNIMVQKIEEMTNTKLDITWVPNSAYDNKVNATIASGSLPMVMNVQNNKLSTILSGVRSGMFWEVGPLLKDYPNLKGLYNEQTTYNASTDGKLYGMPHQRPLGLQMLLYRKDWLDNLGMKPPETIDDVYQMAKAFTEKDPDKNGKKDTYGLVEFMPKLLSQQGFGNALAWFGAPNGYGVKDGKLYPDFTTDEYLEAMKFYRKMFSEKLMNQDFAAIQQGQAWDGIAKEKAGIYPAVVAHATIPNWTALYQANPNAKLDFVTRIKGPKGRECSPPMGLMACICSPNPVSKRKLN